LANGKPERTLIVRSKKITVPMLLVISMMSLGVNSCGSYVPVNFDPIWYVGDYENVGITNRFGQTIPANEPDFNRYACLSDDKLKELIVILREAKIPRRLKEDMIELLENSTVTKNNYPILK
jgi:hypothetical protein